MSPDGWVRKNVSLPGAQRPAKSGTSWYRDHSEKSHVNTAPMGRGNRRLQQLGGVSDKNCALCTAAGVVNLARGTNVWTSSMVAKMLGKEESSTAMGDDHGVQAENIMKFCQPFSGTSCAVQLGTKDKPIGLGAAQTFMNDFPDGTVFAVYVCGVKEGKDKYQFGERAKESANKASHWLNAVKKDGKITYIDFQADHPNREAKPAESDVPILGITGQTVPNSDEMIVLAFTERTLPAAVAPEPEVLSAAKAAEG
jgi:hypothetical protein